MVLIVSIMLIISIIAMITGLFLDKKYAERKAVDTLISVSMAGITTSIFYLLIF